MNSVREKKFMTRSLYVLLFGLESELRLTGTGFDEKKNVSGSDSRKLQPLIILHIV